MLLFFCETLVVITRKIPKQSFFVCKNIYFLIIINSFVMKKYVFLLLNSILLNSSIFSQINEYIDVTTKGVFGRSEMILYCEDLNFGDLEYFYIGANNDNYHCVKYTSAKNVTIIMNDNENDTMELFYENLS